MTYRANRLRSESVKETRLPSLDFRISFSAARYSFRAKISCSTYPPTKAIASSGFMTILQIGLALLHKPKNIRKPDECRRLLIYTSIIKLRSYERLSSNNIFTLRESHGFDYRPSWTRLNRKLPYQWSPATPGTRWKNTRGDLL